MKKVRYIVAFAGAALTVALLAIPVTTRAAVPPCGEVVSTEIQPLPEGETEIVPGTWIHDEEAEPGEGE